MAVIIRKVRIPRIIIELRSLESSIRQALLATRHRTGMPRLEVTGT